MRERSETVLVAVVESLQGEEEEVDRTYDERRAQEEPDHPPAEDGRHCPASAAIAWRVGVLVLGGVAAGWLS